MNGNAAGATNPAVIKYCNYTKECSSTNCYGKSLQGTTKSLGSGESSGGGGGGGMVSLMTAKGTALPFGVSSLPLLLC